MGAIASASWRRKRWFQFMVQKTDGCSRGDHSWTVPSWLVHRIIPHWLVFYQVTCFVSRMMVTWPAYLPFAYSAGSSIFGLRLLHKWGLAWHRSTGFLSTGHHFFGYCWLSAPVHCDLIHGEPIPRPWVAYRRATRRLTCCSGSG